MGKASSSKKVARAAKAGGSLRERPKLAFPFAVFMVVLLGSGLVWVARADRLDALASKDPPVKNSDHWHAAIGVYVCDHFLPPLADIKDKPDSDGIHSHGDGIMHIHPFSLRATGKGARLKVFSDMVGMKLGANTAEIEGTKYFDGYKCGDKPAKVYVYRWSDASNPAVPAEVFANNFGDVRYKNDKEAFTIAVVPEGVEVPRPDSVPQLNKLSDVNPPSGQTPSAPNGAAGATPTPSAGDPSGLPSSTTLPGAPPDQSSTLPGAVSTPSVTAPGALPAPSTVAPEPSPPAPSVPTPPK